MKKKSKWTLDKHKGHYYDLFIGKANRVYEKIDIFYDESTINTLHRKLIEDIKDIDNYTEHYNDWIECPKQDIIDLINERFGVEE
jgi:hypothetical protein